MSNGGRFAKKETNRSQKGSGGKKNNGLTKILITLGVILVLVAAGILGVTVYRMTSIQMEANKPTVPTLVTEPAAIVEVTEAGEEEVWETEETVPETTELPYTPSGKDILNVLVIGDSSREDESAKLADTMILVTVNKLTKTVTLTSFLRDSYVKLPDYMGHTCGSNRINVAYNLGYNWGGQGGAIEMTGLTLKNNFGVEVDHTVVVDFDGFMNAVTLLGSIPIELTKAEANYLNKTLNKSLGYEGYDFREVYDDGSTTSYLYGWECLAYARMRKAEGDGDSDIKRTARQRNLITAIFQQVKNSSMNTLMEFAKQIMQQVTTDMTDDEILTCMWEVLPLLSGLNIQSQVIPADGTHWAKELMVGEYLTYALDFDTKKNKEIMMSIAEADQLAATPVG